MATSSHRYPLAICHAHMEAEVPTYRVIEFAKTKHKHIFPGTFPLSYTYNTFEQFAKSYFALSQLIDHADDFRTLTSYVLEQYKQENVKYAELIFSPDLATQNCAISINWQDMLQKAQEAIHDAEADGTITVTGIVTFLRGDHKKGVESLEYVNHLIQNKNNLPNFRGFHLSGDEDLYPDLTPFIPAYQLARKHGFGCAVHAGETGNPTNILHAIEKLNPHRIGHGTGTIHSQDVINLLKDKDIPLEISVSSSFCLKNIDSLHAHPLPQLIKSNVICLYGNTDDGRLFNTSPSNEINTLSHLFGFSKEDIINNTIRIIEHGFLPEKQKIDLINQIKASQYCCAMRQC